MENTPGKVNHLAGGKERAWKVKGAKWDNGQSSGSKQACGQWWDTWGGRQGLAHGL